MRTRRLPLLALFLVALTLRAPLVGVAPLIPRIESSLAISHAAAAVLLAIPIFCMGACAPLARPLLRSLPSRHVMTLCAVAIVAAGCARAWVPGGLFAVALFTIVVGVGMGVGGAVLPVVVKQAFEDAPGVASAVYVAGMQVGAAAAAGVAIPLAAISSGWRGSLLIQSLMLLPPLLLWIRFSRHVRGADAAFGEPHELDLNWARVARDRAVWLMSGIFTLQALMFYGVMSWGAEIFAAAGWSDSSAGALLGLVQACCLTGTGAMGAAIDHLGSRRLHLVSAAAAFVLGIAGMLAFPQGDYVWAAIVGLALGAVFVAALALPLDFAQLPHGVAAASGAMLFTGYIVASMAAVAFGALRDATGAFTGVLWLLIVASCALIALSVRLSPRRLSDSMAT